MFSEKLSLSRVGLVTRCKQNNFLKCSPAMVFQCQRESFLKEFTTVVESVNKAESGSIEVIFRDTVFFPEGGGQPNDEGVLIKTSDQTKYFVKNVVRRGPTAVHILTDENDPLAGLKESDEVVQKIDWERRYDHMQQHSGQHLITALFEREFNNPTKSWWLGSESSYIELGGGDVSESAMRRVEMLCNELIAEARSVDVRVYEKPEDAGEDVTRASRGLPLDLSGPIRVVTIAGVDSNMCCGTHVSNLAQLQAVKLMGVEKAKGKVMVHFLVGNRVLKRLEVAHRREQELNVLLNGGPEAHSELIRKLQATNRSGQKTLQRLSKELATLLATKLNEDPSPPPIYFLNRSDGVSVDFAANFLGCVKAKVFLFVTIADGVDSRSGSLVLRGDARDVDAISGEVVTLLEGKGSTKNGCFRAKVTKLNKLGECEAFVKKYFGIN